MPTRATMPIPTLRPMISLSLLLECLSEGRNPGGGVTRNGYTSCAGCGAFEEMALATPSPPI